MNILFLTLTMFLFSSSIEILDLHHSMLTQQRNLLILLQINRIPAIIILSYNLILILKIRK